MISGGIQLQYNKKCQCCMSQSPIDFKECKYQKMLESGGGGGGGGGGNGHPLNLPLDTPLSTFIAFKHNGLPRGVQS